MGPQLAENLIDDERDLSIQPTEESESRRRLGLPSVEAEAADQLPRKIGDVFCGEGGIGREVSLSCRCQAEFIDSGLGPDHNLLRQRPLRRLGRRVRR